MGTDETRESRWTRWIPIAKNSYRIESKFQTGEVSIELDELVELWEGMGQCEKIDFTQAFSCKKIKERDHAILRFLMQTKDPHVLSIVVSRLDRLPEKKAITRFLLDGLEAAWHRGLSANYFQAIRHQAMNDAVAVIEKRVQELEDDPALWETGERGFNLLAIECVGAAAALMELDGSPRHRALLTRLAEHPSETVRRNVQEVLFQKWSAN